ncbi:hypothetical protein MUP65_01000 [Patescibacteria group bacterium]|nr:hypothetical protein [Patescibacteria group bacterium]
MKLPIKKTITIILFSVLVPVNLSLVILGLSRSMVEKTIAHQPTEQYPSISVSQYPTHIYASLPAETGIVLGETTSADARALILERYLEKYNSAMQPYGEIAQCIVDVSDQYGLDWRLLVAIAQQESNLGKKMPEGCNNAWGWGIHSQGTLCFNSWEEGIKTVAKGLKTKYLDHGLITSEEIMAKYTPHSSGSWALGVNQFLDDLRLGDTN